MASGISQVYTVADYLGRISEHLLSVWYTPDVSPVGDCATCDTMVSGMWRSEGGMTRADVLAAISMADAKAGAPGHASAKAIADEVMAAYKAVDGPYVRGLEDTARYFGEFHDHD